MAKISKFVSLAGLITLSVVVTACGGGNNYDRNIVNETYFHKYGVVVPADYWTSSGEHGNVISTMTDGVVVSRSYSSGTLNGETTYTYPHSSQIQKSETYSTGMLDKETEFFFDGTPKRETVYNSPSSGMRTVSTWYLSGTPKCIERYEENQLVSAEYFTSLNQRDAFVDNLQGTRLMRDDYGQLISTDTIESGRMVLRQTYHPNGSPKETTSYKNDLVDGFKRTFHPAGEPDTVEQWAQGQQEGLSVVYQHGDKFAEVPYVNGEKHGVECRYRDGKTKVQEVSWNSGKLHGPTTTYVGDSPKTDWYFKGNPVSKADYEFMTNKPIVH